MIFSSSMISIFGIINILTKKVQAYKPGSVPSSQENLLESACHLSSSFLTAGIHRSTHPDFLSPKWEKDERATLDQGLFDLSTHKVYHAIPVTRYPVGSYPTFSPLPRQAGRYILCGTGCDRTVTNTAPSC